MDDITGSLSARSASIAPTRLTRGALLKHLQRMLTRPATWGVIAILIAGAYVRFSSIGFGLPYRYHIDEQGWIAYGGRLCSGEFNFPAWTAGPNFLHVLMCGGDIALFIAGLGLGEWSSISGFRAWYESDPTGVYLVGRSISALVGTATAFLVFLLGSRLWNRRVGFLGMTFLALTYLHARDSHFVVSDILVTFLLTGCLILCYDAIERRGSLRLFAGAGLLAGLATGVKFSLVFSALPLAVAFLLVQREGWKPVDLFSSFNRKRITAIGLGFLAGFVVGYPNILNAFVDYQDLAADFVSEWQASLNRARLWQIEPDPGWLFYAQALTQGMGLPLAALAGVGVLHSIGRRSFAALLLLSFALPFYLFLGGQAYYTAHYMIPTLPAFLLLGASFLDKLAQAWPTEEARRNLGLAVLSGLILLPSVLSILRFNQLMQREDTRTLAKEWIEANVPAGAKIAVSLYTSWEPPLSTFQFPQPYSTRNYNVEVYGGLGGITDASYEKMSQAGFEYVLVSSYVYDIPLRDPARAEARAEWFRKLESNASLLYVVTPYAGSEKPPFDYDQIYGPWSWMERFERPGPTIYIYHLP